MTLPNRVTVAYAHCCSGSVRVCDCVNKNHGTVVIGENEAGEDYPIVSPTTVQAHIVGWLYEDTLPDGYPYDAMYPYSKVDGVRLFPVFAPLPPVQNVALSPAASDVLAERRRQIDAEGFSIAHDDTHTAGEMAFAAACYAASGAVDEAQRGKDDRLLACIQFIWPKAWAWGWWTPKNRRRDLVRAGALIIAEIERIDRFSQNQKSEL